MIRNKPRDAAVFGVDIGKNVFHVVGADASGEIVQRAKFRRETVLVFFQRANRTLVGMEACPGAQWLARKLQAMGHSVRIIPARSVKPYVKSNKNDMIDAAAIAEAVTRPTMRFVEVKSAEQVDIQALHRIRDQIVRNRTRLICQMRAFCLEHGVAIRQGAGVFKLDLPRIIGEQENDLTPTMRRLLADLFEDLKRLEVRIKEVTREIEALASKDDRARRLMTVPGIGPLGATASLATAGDAHQFKKARDMAAWLGLVPREHSTAGQTMLMGISKRGSTFLHTRAILFALPRPRPDRREAFDGDGVGGVQGNGAFVVIPRFGRTPETSPRVAARGIAVRIVGPSCDGAIRVGLGFPMATEQVQRLGSIVERPCIVGCRRDHGRKIVERFVDTTEPAEYHSAVVQCRPHHRGETQRFVEIRKGQFEATHLLKSNAPVVEGCCHLCVETQSTCEVLNGFA
jgi:transposase